MARIQEWCNHWCMIQNPNTTKALVVSRSRTVNHPHGDLALSWVSNHSSPNFDILVVKLDGKLTFEDHVRGIVSCVSENWYFGLDETCLCGHLCVTRCYFAFVLPILEYCSPVWGSAAECHLQLLERQVYSVARLCRDHSFLSLCHRRHVAGLCMLYTVNNSISNHCLFSKLTFASTRVWHCLAADASHPLELEVARCRMSQFAKCFLPAQTHMWNHLPYTVFDSGTLGGCKGNVGYFHELCIFQFSVTHVLVGLRKQFISNFFQRGSLLQLLMIITMKIKSLVNNLRIIIDTY